MHPHLGIVISPNEPYGNGAERLHQTCSIRFPTVILSIEEMMRTANLPSKLYLLSNAGLVPFIAQHAAKSGIKVINGSFLVKSLRKDHVQSVLQASGVNTPHNHEGHEISLFPIIIKTHGHGGKVSVVMNDTEYVAATLQANNWYAETYIDGDLETKVYVVNEQIFCRQNISLQDVALSIRKALGLSVFSFDAIRNKENNQWFIVDVNPAPAFFHSVKAREAFAEFIQRIT